MSSEGKRQEVIALVKTKTLRQPEAATVLGISIRQVKRLCRAERERGTIGGSVAPKSQYDTIY